MVLQAQEGLISQLCDENLKLAEEIQRLNTRSACNRISVASKHES